MEYTQLDKTVRLNAVTNRIRDIERQYLDISLRVTAPDLQAVANEMDAQNLAKLEDSLTKLHAMEAQLKEPTPPAGNQTGAGASPAQSPPQQ